MAFTVVADSRSGRTYCAGILSRTHAENVLIDLAEDAQEQGFDVQYEYCAESPIAAYAHIGGLSHIRYRLLPVADFSLN